MEIITPRAIHDTGAQLTVWCTPCRQGRLVRIDLKAWGHIWDREIAELWVRPGFRCSRCGAAAGTLTVQRIMHRGGAMETMLDLSRNAKSPATLSDDGA
jgi:hypothetical protein